MPTFFLGADAVHGARVAFDAKETHHLSRVLRLRPGDVVRALDGTGHELTVRLTRVEGRRAEGEVLGRQSRSTESPLTLTLVQGLPKGDRMETVIRMATELGVSRIVPVLTERSVVRPDAAGGGGRLARWQRVARESAKQCGRTVLPDVEAVRPLSRWLATRDAGGLLLCLWEDEPASLAERLPAERVSRATLVVGPEGGLTPAEVSLLTAEGAVVAGLGPRILRTETAGPVGLALLQARYGDLWTAREASDQASRK